MMPTETNPSTHTPVKRLPSKAGRPKLFPNNPVALGIQIDEATLVRLKQYGMPVSAACRMAINGYFKLMDDALVELTSADLVDIHRIMRNHPTDDWTVLWSRALDAGNLRLAHFIRDMPPLKQQALHDYLIRATLQKGTNQ